MTRIAFSQTLERTISVSYQLQLGKLRKIEVETEKRIITPPDVYHLLQEDKQNEEKGGVAFRFGDRIPVIFNLENSGHWNTLENGDRLWLITIRSDSAKSLNLIYENLSLPEGATLCLYNADKSQVSCNAKGYKSIAYAIGIFAGDQVTLEYFEPKSQMGKGIVSISHVVYGYRLVNSVNTRIQGDGRKL